MSNKSLLAITQRRRGGNVTVVGRGTTNRLSTIMTYLLVQVYTTNMCVCIYVCIDQAVYNAYILCKEAPNHRYYIGWDNTQIVRSFNHLEFQTELARELIRNFTSRKRGAPPDMLPEASHWPEKTKRGECHLCRSRRKRAQVSNTANFAGELLFVLF